jgi:DNA-binding MarR family transcriptional regulator
MHITYPLASFRSQAQLIAQASHLRSLPNFDAAWADYTRKLSVFSEANRPISKLLANEDRYRALNFSFTLWAEKVALGGDGSLTYGELYEICRRGEVSSRILKTMLSLAVFSGFLDRRRNPQDGRSWLYKPTGEMIAFPQQWLMPAAQALDALQPDRDRAHRLRTDPGVLIYFFRSAGREFASGVQPMTVQPEFMSFFGQREGGAVFTMALLLSELEGNAPASRSDIATRYGLTKSQVNLLVTTGLEMKLVRLDNGVLRPTDRMRNEHAEWIALSLAFLGHHLWPEDAN